MPRPHDTALPSLSGIMGKFVMNADDLGFNEQVNKAIGAAFREGLCSSATVMANMEGFDDACELIHRLGLLLRVGLHLVLTEGVPLTDRMRGCRRFCDGDGRFAVTRAVRIVRLDTDEREAVIEEARAQIARCRSHRVALTHMDSHSHIHEEWGVGSILLKILATEGIPFLRLARNLGPRTSLVKDLYRRLYNHRLRAAHLARTRFFCSMQDYLWAIERGSHRNGLRSCEVMIHPTVDAQGRIVDAVCGCMLEDAIRRIPWHCEAVSFAGVGIGS